MEYDLTSHPVVVARAPLLNIESAQSLLSSEDVESSTRDLLISQPTLLAALQLSSPSLFASVESWLAGKRPKNKKFFTKLAKYLVRAAARCTPFGLFATVGNVVVAEGDELRLASEERIEAFVRADMAWAEGLLTSIEERLGWAHLPVNLCDTVLETSARVFAGANYHRIAPTRSEVASGDTGIVSFRNNDVYQFIKNVISSERISASDLALRLTKNLEVDGAAVISDLLKAGVLYFAIRPAPQSDVDGHLRELLREIGDEEAASALRALEAVEQMSGAVPRISVIKDTIASLTSVVPSVEMPLQLDARRDLLGDFPTTLIDAVEEYGSLLARTSVRPSMAAYVRRFIAKFEGETQIVPLKELVDPSIGIGVPDLPSYPQRSYGPHHVQRLMRLILDAERESKTEVQLTDADIDQMFPAQDKSDQQPRTFEFGFQVWAASYQAIRDGDYRIVPIALNFTNAAGRSLGRFLHMLGETTTEAVRWHVGRGVASDEILAENCYWPLIAKSANVLRRPRLVDHEIQVGFEDRSVDRVDLDDLFVGIADNYELFLWSKSREKRVVVRESHVHNPALAPGVAKFFAALSMAQHPVPQGFIFNTFASFPHAPRIAYGKFVLSVERWHMETELLKKDDWETYLDDFRERFKVPNECLIALGDNRLFVNLSTTLGREMLRDEAFAMRGAVLVILDAGIGQSNWLRSERGTHVAEFVVSTSRNSVEKPDVVTASPRPISKPLTELFSQSRIAWHPGTQWAFFKIYTGALNIDAALNDVLRPIIEEYQGTLFDRWFFIRYADPNSHIRLRLRSTDGASLSDLYSAVSSRLRDAANARLIDHFSNDTYRPEYERYGGVYGTDLCEAIFNIDSRAALDAFRGSPQAREQRNIVALATAAYLFRPFFDRGRNLHERKPTRKQGAEDRTAIRSASELFEQLIRTNGSAATQNVIDDLWEAEEAGRLVTPVSSIFSSLFHMHCNRFGVGLGDESLLRFQYSAVEQRWKHTLKDAQLLPTNTQS